MLSNRLATWPRLALATSLALPATLAVAQSTPVIPDAAAPATTTTPAGPTVAEAAAAQWYLRDPQLDKTPGTGTTRAYAELLKGRVPTAVVVAVIDSGIDTAHVDLKPVLWRNPGEIPGNGIDDDKNGYIDDVHGWNFLGGKDGRNISVETLEVTRVVAKLGPRFAGKTAAQVKAADKADYATYLKAKKAYDAKRKELTEELQQGEQISGPLTEMTSMLKQKLGVTRLDTATMRQAAAKLPEAEGGGLLLSLYQNMKQGGIGDTDALLAEIGTELKDQREQLDYSLNTKFNARADIVKDNPDDVTQRNYGNNDVTGPDALHGTHVAGIIAAVRTNNLGVQGIAAAPVQVMSVRAVPNGDERDKDVANAIRYAVDNGAQIINMSFGKEFSPQRPAVEAAYKYAASKNVLLVHAAGNEDDNLDVIPHYPASFYLDGTVPPNLLTVGASGPQDDENLTASFSNYSKRQVDVFAPGVGIYSTLPGNKYGSESGTSMASPVTAGVAAVLKSYYPSLTAVDLKRIIRQSAQVHHTLVLVPGEKGKKADFATLSATGGIVDLYAALQLAAQTEATKKP
ncbi:S8 family serine peptidase [Hymenobacter sp. HMF4947]|uniref:S8 family serine peptidase n=1 Tax=Hymenobacter ginkgonis TaxID=2682976 RepID=A0A7K1TAL7_9BACT|nr:S8 family peptidase [Hymenobacter ginkgonis]MVN75444.1 S8 family serine peptidase [Hymenobacter ginkgonis]